MREVDSRRKAFARRGRNMPRRGGGHIVLNGGRKKREDVLAGRGK